MTRRLSSRSARASSRSSAFAALVAGGFDERPREDLGERRLYPAQAFGGGRQCRRQPDGAGRGFENGGACRRSSQRISHRPEIARISPPERQPRDRTCHIGDASEGFAKTLARNGSGEKERDGVEPRGNDRGVA